MSRNLVLLVASLLACERLLAQAALTLDILDAADGLPLPPAGILVVDAHVDVAAGDFWTAAGVRVTVHRGARIIYADTDLNTPEPTLVNPGPDNRYVTLLSRPRGRNGDARFTNGGAAPAGGYCPASPQFQASPWELDVAYFASPPQPPGTPTTDGWVLRVAVDVSDFCAGRTPWGPMWIRPEGWPEIGEPVLVIECDFSDPGFVNATRNVTTPHGSNSIIVAQFTEYPLLPAGDVNCDCVVGPGDLAELLSGFGYCDGQDGYGRRLDINESGCVDIRDLTLLLADIGEAAPC